MAPLDGNVSTDPQPIHRFRSAPYGWFAASPLSDTNTDALVAAARQPANGEEIEHTAALMGLARAMNAARYADEMDVDPLCALARRIGRAPAGSMEEQTAIAARLLCVMTDNERRAFFARIAPTFSTGTAADWAQAAVDLTHDIISPLTRIEFDRFGDWLEVIGDDAEERKAAALRWLDMMETRLESSDGVDRVQAYAGLLANAALLRMRDANIAAAKAGDDVVFGKAITTRITDNAWLARHIRRRQRAGTIHLGDTLKQVGGSRKYLAADTADLCRKAEQRCTEFLNTAVAVSDAGGAARLSALYKKATERRMATAYSLIHAMDEYRRMLDGDYVAVFVTLTCPGAAVPLSGNEEKRKSAYNPRKWHFEARKAYLTVEWHGRVLTPLAAFVERRGRRLFGIWTHEGTKAGVPHKHILLYLHKDDVAHLYKLVTGGDEPEGEFNPTPDAVLEGLGGARLGKHEHDWHIGPYRVDIPQDENDGAFAASRVNIRVLKEKSEESDVLSSITSYVMKYVRKNAQYDALSPEQTSDEARFARAHGMRTYGFFGLPKGVSGIWSMLATSTKAPEKTLTRQIGDLIRARKDGEALQLLDENHSAWRKVTGALRRLEGAKGKGKKMRRATAEKLHAVIREHPERALVRVSEARVTRYGGIYKATRGRAEVKGAHMLVGLRGGLRGRKALEAKPLFSNVKAENWTITLNDSVLPLLDIDRDQQPPEAAIDAAKEAVAAAMKERDARRPVEGGFQPDGATSAMWFREAMNAALGLEPLFLKVKSGVSVAPAYAVATTQDLHESSREAFGPPAGQPEMAASGAGTGG